VRKIVSLEGSLEETEIRSESLSKAMTEFELPSMFKDKAA